MDDDFLGWHSENRRGLILRHFLHYYYIVGTIVIRLALHGNKLPTESNQYAR